MYITMFVDTHMCVVYCVCVRLRERHKQRERETETERLYVNKCLVRCWFW